MSQQAFVTPPRIAIGVLSLLAVALIVIGGPTAEEVRIQKWVTEGRLKHDIRQAVWDELRPVAVVNCDMKRMGRAADGGYILCSNQLEDVQAIYSYGINGEDSFGCDLSGQLGVELHQYDCFNTTRVTCPQEAANPIFHEECVGAREETIDDRLFDTVAHQVARTGHAGEHIFVKMDIEGAEVDSLVDASPELLSLVDQLVIELHGPWEPGILDLVRHLKGHFVVADVHFNNCACAEGIDPFPSWAIEVLFVNKRIAEVDPDARVAFPNPEWLQNARSLPDCQKGWD